MHIDGRGFVVLFIALTLTMSCAPSSDKFCSSSQIVRYKTMEGKVAEFLFVGKGNNLRYEERESKKILSTFLLPSPIKNGGREFYIPNIIKFTTSQLIDDSSNNDLCGVVKFSGVRPNRIWKIKCYRNNGLNLNEFIYSERVGISSIRTSCVDCRSEEYFHLEGRHGLAGLCSH